MSSINKACAVCNVAAVQHCGSCRLVFYCGRDHQKQHWKDGHKFNCIAYKIQVNGDLGRHMVATRDIKQGEIIHRAEPLVVAPKIASLPLCLGCYKRLKPTDKVNYYKCTNCGWPMCDQACQNKKDHVRECELMKKVGYTASIDYKAGDNREIAYCTIAPLRSMLLDKDKYKQLMELQSHLEERANTPLYTVLKANVVTFFHNVLGLTNVSEEEILKLAAIWDTNAFEIRKPEGDIKIRGIYHTVSMMSHNCKANTKHVFVDYDFTLLLIATVPISKGELITATYTQTLMGTLSRRSHIKQVKCFDCVCERCKDPTEFGTYVGSIYCSRCQVNEVAQVPMMISSNPLDVKAPWNCEKCDHTLQAKQINWGNDAIKKEIAAMDKSKPKPLEEFLLKYAATLHPTNMHVLEVKYALTQMYGNLPGYLLSELNDAALERKISLCHELLEISDKLEPGWSRFRGHLLLDLQSTMAVQAKRDFNNGKITKEAAQETMTESMVLLQESTNILSPEPEMKELLQDRLKALANELDFD